MRNAAIRANSLYKVGRVVSGGERHLIETGGGVITSSNFGGAVGLNDTVLSRQDGKQSFFYSNS